jgi:hypothetical protein
MLRLHLGGLLALALALHAGGRAAWPRATAGLAVGALLAGAQLLPSWAFLPHTARGLALDQAMREQWALSPGRVLSVARGAEAIAVEAESDGPALLVVNDAWWPGWAAEIDEAPAPILPADGLVRAVPSPGGRQRLVMRYEPPEVRTGLAVSALGLVPLAALAAWETRSRRSARLPGRAPSGGAAAQRPGQE